MSRAEVSQDTWILFPWNIEPQLVQLIIKLEEQQADAKAKV